MENSKEILQLIDKYLNDFSYEVERTKAIVTFLNSFDGSQLFDRRNFVGHITASAYIINQSKKSLLLLKHKTLNRWLQPGGHIDPWDTSIKAAAIREVKEETGINTTLLFPISESILDIDSHPIPENPRRQEAAHVHHDLSFLFICAELQPIEIDESESTAARWVPFKELLEDSNYRDLLSKIDSVINKTASAF